MATPLRFSVRKVLREYRVKVRKEKKKRGVLLAKPTYVFCVQPQTIDVPEWAKEQAFKELHCSDTVVWLKRSDMKMLKMQDGGHALITKTEYRRCPQCGQFLLGDLAVERRRKDEARVCGRMEPCDGECTQRAWRKKGIECQ